MAEGRQNTLERGKRSRRREKVRKRREIYRAGEERNQ